MHRAKKWLHCLLPPTEEEDYVLRESGVEGVTDPSSSETATKLRHLLDETADLIDSPSFSFVLTLLLNEGFSTLVDVKCANEAFKALASAPETAPQSFDSMATVVPPVVSERKTKLANLLAVLARQAHVIGHGPMGPNEYLDVMDKNVRELEAFSAVIYSSNFDLELLGATRDAAGPGAESLDPNSPPTFSTVVIDNEPESRPVVDLAESTPVLVDLEDRVTEVTEEVEEPKVTEVNAAEEPTEVASEETPGETAFEAAWGKAVDNEKVAAEKDAEEAS